MIFYLIKIIDRLQQAFAGMCRAARKHYLKVLHRGRLSYGKGFFLKSTSLIFFDITDASMRFGNSVQIRDHCFFRCEKNGSLTVGDNVFFNNGCSLNCLHTISVGNNCQFGEGVKIYDHNHMHADKTQLIASQGYVTGAITVGDNCWIGSNVIILKNVTIGDNAVIGAGCIIYKPVPANAVVINHQELAIKF